MTPHHYTITVARQYGPLSGITNPLYQHFFRTARVSITTREEYDKVYARLCKAFPRPRWQVTGTAHIEYDTSVGER